MANPYFCNPLVLSMGKMFKDEPFKPLKPLNLNRGSSSFGRARPCQGRGGRFEPGLPLRESSCRVGGGFFLYDSD